MKFKSGDTFDYSGAVDMVDGAGDTIDMTDWTVASKIRFPDTDIKVSLSAEWIGDNFTHVRIHKAETKDWPVGPADIDIEFTSTGGAIVSTETIRFTILEDLT